MFTINAAIAVNVIYLKPTPISKTALNTPTTQDTYDFLPKLGP